MSLQYVFGIFCTVLCLWLVTSHTSQMASFCESMWFLGMLGNAQLSTNSTYVVYNI